MQQREDKPHSLLIITDHISSKCSDISRSVDCLEVQCEALIPVWLGQPELGREGVSVLRAGCSGAAVTWEEVGEEQRSQVDLFLMREGYLPFQTELQHSSTSNL